MHFNQRMELFRMIDTFPNTWYSIIMKISNQSFVRVCSLLHCSHIEEHKLDSFQNISVFEVGFVNRNILESTSKPSCLWLHKSSLMPWNSLWNECQWRSWIANIIWLRFYMLLNHQAKAGEASDQSSSLR